MRLSSFIIGILSVAFIISVIAVIASNIATNSPYTVGNTNFSSYQKMESLNNKSMAIKKNVSAISSEKTGFDIVGRLFGTGADTVKLTYSSVELGLDMATDGFGGNNDTGGIPLGSTGSLVNTFVIAGLTILLFIGIILSIIIRRDV